MVNTTVTATTVTVTFVCSDLLYTDLVYRIQAWVYPKGSNYHNALTSFASELFRGVEHRESYTFTGLTPNTEYEIYAVITGGETATDHNALVTFTTDGTEELDFSNATLAVESVSVDYTDVSIKLAYTGLPYMADGESVAFQIYGITDAGDSASVRKITSGSGTVRGHFYDLEPLTDYTATFGIFYNGEPTGVSATVDFTTAEEFVGGYDRDSFLMGFASGLGATAATKTDAEYNSWMWGYIAGSALRKAL